MIQLPKLKPNDLVAIVATGRSVKPEQLTTAFHYLKQWNLDAILGKNLYADYYNGYSYAGTKEQRLEDFQEALNNPKVKAIWFAAGGYGAVHLIEELDLTEFYKHPKWLIGYSDITVFHQFFNGKGIPTLLANTAKPLNISYDKISYDSIKNAMFGMPNSYEIPNHSLNVEGEVRGILLGGNLSIIYSLLGTKYNIDSQNFILLIEDWYENWYHLDRMMNALKMNGLLQKAKAIIVGSFTKMDVKEENSEFELEYDSKSYEILYEHLKPMNIPLMFGFPTGHIGDHRALALGTEINLTITNHVSKIEYTQNFYL